MAAAAQNCRHLPPPSNSRHRTFLVFCIVSSVQLISSAASSFIEAPIFPDKVYIHSESPSGRLRLVMPKREDAECDVVGDQAIIRSILNNSSSVEFVGRSEFQQLLRKCEDIHAQLYRNTLLISSSSEDYEFSDRVDGLFPKRSGRRKTKSSFWSKNIFNQLLIMPGTKWCGQGDIAEHANDLGYHSDVDRCCRDHDLCLAVSGEFLAPGQCRSDRNLCNNSAFTRSACECDQLFKKCLRSNPTRISNAVGRLFFNIAGVTCYRYEHPKRCVEFVSPPKHFMPKWILGATKVNEDPEKPRCKRYELDRNQPKMWQFFETFFEEAPRQFSSSKSIKSRRGRRQRGPMTFLQDIMIDLFLRVVDPI